ncbi:hypothetical protein HB364_18410 [Pseudoflavitalea sp. X16]|uniref:hypothetical protein n=1 Tax=Paraflavitalea devenefica TaxID=2716334 RepID=UPI00141D990B|nr:hypothetical protein [Paraflavitalea devenefica]NII27070.1 hypothetical protein [Paraflavitalea devenefica]
MKKNAPIIGIIAFLTCLLFWIACQKNEQASIVQQTDVENMEGGAGPSPVDTISPNPIYNITDSCGVTCLAGSCGRKATFDGRYCKLVCKCGGVLGGYPQCDLICNFPTTPPGPGPDTSVQYTPRLISYRIEANDKQMQAQAALIAKMKTSGLKHADKIVHELQEIYNLFKHNNGKLTEANAEKYSYHLAKGVAWQEEK